MLAQFLSLQWKSFTRSASFSTHLSIKILIGFLLLYFAATFAFLGALAYHIIQDELARDPLETVNQFMIYGCFYWVVMRYFIQKTPVFNITPLLVHPISKNKIVHFAMGKTLSSGFNWLGLFFMIPFAIVLVVEGYHWVGVLSWFVGIMAFVMSTNYFNLLINNNQKAGAIALSVLALLGGLHYVYIFDITVCSGPVFQALYQYPIAALVPIALWVFLYKAAFADYKKEMYIDGGLALQQADAKTQEFTWLNRFGKTAVFLKNDLRLILRNKRSKSTALMSFLFLFYGLFFFTGSVEMYNSPMWSIFAGIFISGGFLFSFGQFVPSWDSAYYPLLMTQNTSYREYLNSKWLLIVVATLISWLLSTPYIYFGWDVFFLILAATVYNVGVNSYLVLWGGAYIKMPIDLTSNKKAFGDKQAFNIKTLLLTIPKLVLPVLIYFLGSQHSEQLGIALVALTGVMGLAFKNHVFSIIERIYVAQKHKTLWAYKQK
jgi:hypothetical protein